MNADQLCNRAYESIAAGVAALNPGVIIDNGPTPLFGDVQTQCDALITREYHSWHRDDYTGFDDPIRDKLPVDHSTKDYSTARRVFTSGVRIMYNFDKSVAKTAADAKVIKFVFDGGGSMYAKCLWMDDIYYADWFEYQRTAWTKAREIDVRLLTNEEMLAVKILTEATTRALHGSTRCTPILRCTVEQIYFLVQHDNTKGHFSYLKADLSKMGQLDEVLTTYFRRQAPAELTKAAERVLNMADIALAFIPELAFEQFRQMRAAHQAFDAQERFHRENMVLVKSGDHGVPDRWVLKN